VKRVDSVPHNPFFKKKPQAGTKEKDANLATASNNEVKPDELDCQTLDSRSDSHRSDERNGPYWEQSRKR